MRLFFSTLIFFCFATVSAQCTYGDIEISVTETGSTYKRITITNTATGEAYESSNTSQNYDQLPEALNWVGSWVSVSDYCKSINIDWDEYTINGVAGYNTSCFAVNLLILNGVHNVQPDGSVVLFNDNALTSFDLCQNASNMEISVTGDTYKRITITNT
jgi:hypothetical protein